MDIHEDMLVLILRTVQHYVTLNLLTQTCTWFQHVFAASDEYMDLFHLAYLKHTLQLVPPLRKNDGIFATRGYVEYVTKTLVPVPFATTSVRKLKGKWQLYEQWGGPVWFKVLSMQVDGRLVAAFSYFNNGDHCTSIYAQSGEYATQTLRAMCPFIPFECKTIEIVMYQTRPAYSSLPGGPIKVEVKASNLSLTVSVAGVLTTSAMTGARHAMIVYECKTIRWLEMYLKYP
jgi:hypothetical protein